MGTKINNIDTEHFGKDAKQIVDMCFNNKLFKDEITRDDMNNFEELISFLLQSKFNMYVKCEELLASLDKDKK